MSTFREALSPKELETDFQALVENERWIKNYKTTGTGILPRISVAGLKWHELAQQLSSQERPIKLLDLGTGDDCAAWTGGLDGSRLNEKAMELQTKGLQIEVTAHSASGRFKEWVESHGVDRLLTGHFLDVLQDLESKGEKFHLVLSRWALYSSVAVFRIIELVETLLADNGAAYLEEIYRSIGNGKVLIFPQNNAPQGLLNYEIVDNLCLTPKQAQVGNLPVIELEGHSHLGWKKGELDRTKLPKFVGITQFEKKYLGHTGWGMFEAQA